MYSTDDDRSLNTVDNFHAMGFDLSRYIQQHCMGSIGHWVSAIDKTTTFKALKYTLEGP